MSTARQRRMSPLEFLAWESQQTNKHEYHSGEIWDLAGGTDNHARIARNIIIEIGNYLKDKPYEIFGSDLLIATPRQSYYYPDLFIACEPIEYASEQHRVVTNPKVIFEVHSPSTELIDRVTKFEAYTQIPSLTDYVMVRQNWPVIEHWHYRTEQQEWAFKMISGLEQQLSLPEDDLQLSLADIYYKVIFPPEQPKAPLLPE
jgi:Uma2 family endonuclease